MSPEAVKRRPPPRLRACGSCRQFAQPEETVCPHCGAPLAGSLPERIEALRQRMETLSAGEGGPPVDLEVTLPARTWRVIAAEPKLAARAALPGASVYDEVATTLVKAQGLSTAERLAIALPASWLVNARASSPTFQGWLRPDAKQAWAALVEKVRGGPKAWLERAATERDEALGCVRALCGEGGLAAVSKVLALLAPETIPLMDDAAIAFVTGGLPMPETDDRPTAGPEHFLPMLDGFCRAVAQGEAALERLGAQQGPMLLPAQVLDRLLWFDSWGLQYFAATVE